jgi:hypothetical protein
VRRRLATDVFRCAGETNQPYLFSYQLEAICDCAQACVQSLLRDSHQPIDLDESEGAPPPATGDGKLDTIPRHELERAPNQSAREVLHELSSLAGESQARKAPSGEFCNSPAKSVHLTEPKSRPLTQTIAAQPSTGRVLPAGAI